MIELRGILEKYKEVSLNLIRSIEDDDDSSEMLIIKREELLNLLKGGNFAKKDLIDIANELELVRIEQTVMESIIIAKENVKSEMIELKKQRDANKSYGTNFKNINFINRKI